MLRLKKISVLRSGFSSRVLLSASLLIALIPLTVHKAWCGPAEKKNETQKSANRYEWPMKRGNPGLTGCSPDTSVKPPLRRRWAYRTASYMFRAEPCVAAGKLFVCAAKGLLVSLDADTGEPVWTSVDLIDGRKRWSTICFAGNRVFLGTRSKKTGKAVLALDADTGRTIWKYPLVSYTIILPPQLVPAEGKLFFTRTGSSGIFVVALNQDDGTEVWTRRIGGPEVWSKDRPGQEGWNLGRQVCYADGLIYASASKAPPLGLKSGRKASEGRVVALKPGDGSVVWQRDTCPGGGWEHTKHVILVSDGKILCCGSSYRRSPEILDAKTGKYLWTTQKKHKDAVRGHIPWNKKRILTHRVLVEGDPGLTDIRRLHSANWFVIADKYILGSNAGIRLQYGVYDKETGKYLGQAGGICFASRCSQPAVSGTYAYSGMGTAGMPGYSPFGQYGVSSLGAIDLETRKLVWSHRLERNTCSPPVIAYGRVYMCCGGWVYCFEPLAEEDSSSTQMKGPVLTPDFDIAGLKKDYKKLGKPSSPGRGETFKGTDKVPGGTSWPMYGGCPERCGLNMKIKLPIAPAWKFDTGGAVHSSAAIHNGLAYVGSDSGKLFALDLDTGSKRWEFKAGGKVHCSPAVGKGLVVFGSDDGKLYALGVNSGEKKWEFQTGDYVRAAPAIVGNRVVFGSWDRCIYALSLADGKQLWRFVTHHEIHAPPAVYKGRVFAGSGDWLLYALNLDSGKLDWYRWMKGSVHGLAVYRNMVTAHAGRDHIAYFCPENGEAAMKQVDLKKSSHAVFGAPAFSGDWMFLGRWLYFRGMGIVNLREEKSYHPLGQASGSGCLETPLTTKDIMILATMTGKVEAHSVYDGKTPSRKLWEWKTPSGKMFHASPAAASGHIVVGNDDGFVYGFRYTEKQ